jgi:hypothetical protein
MRAAPYKNTQDFAILRAATKQGWAIISHANGTTKGTSRTLGHKVSE